MDSGRFTQETMTTLLHEVADKLELDASEAQLLNLTNNAVFALPRAGVVVRIPRSRGLDERVQKVVRVAHWFHQIDAPTIRLAYPDPVEVSNVRATVWHFLPQTSQHRPTTADLGHVLHTFHHLPLPDSELPRWNPVADARARIVDAENLADDARYFLLEWCDQLETDVKTLSDRPDNSIIHGDAHASNLLHNKQGETVFCDFDAVCIGPWGVDLAAVAVGDMRFHNVGKYKALREVYGRDVTQTDEWSVLQQARELKMIVAVVPYLASGNGVREEFELRLNSIRHRDTSVQWTPFAQLAAK